MLGFDTRAWLTYSMIKSLSPSKYKEVWIRPDKWAKRLGCNVATFRKTLNKLIDLGFLDHRYYHPYGVVSKKYRLVKLQILL